MEKNYKENFKKNNGITLIALVITIMVLLILAGKEKQWYHTYSTCNYYYSFTYFGRCKFKHGI